MTLATVAAASGEDCVPFDMSTTQRTVFSAFARARRKFGGKRVCLIDVDDSERTYDEIMRGTLALGSALLEARLSEVAAESELARAWAELAYLIPEGTRP